jgi:conjugative transfer signal peptidase TraF
MMPAQMQSARAAMGDSERAFGYSAALLCGIALLAVAAFKSVAPVLLFNPSTSAPRGWYLLSPDAPNRVGQYALARLPPSVARLADERRYLPLGTNLLKQVAALHGDFVCADGIAVRINRRPVAHLRSEDSHHRPLTAWRGCLVLPKQQYFLLSATNAASFDSRYFGPLDGASIVGRAVPLWTWP